MANETEKSDRSLGAFATGRMLMLRVRDQHFAPIMFHDAMRPFGGPDARSDRNQRPFLLMTTLGDIPA